MGSVSESSSSKTASLDKLLHMFGFEIEEVSPKRLTGHLKVTDKCCQRWKVLHGGIVALIAESLASMGAHMASGFRRIAGIELSINHLAEAHLGDVVMADAAPVNLGRTLQVWRVQLWKINPSAPESTKVLISTSNVSIISNLPIPVNVKNAAVPLMKYAKL
ncbi:1,4-dihydroxy-2-naphthoyl-CoA thioesterase 1-like [Macadamia integrifolia]|uniref:1,4-dihydroxy-2-naphthoyl-CoA thioesterase 1-like n=1 Tax=Macadamia integrifolia TaxID=60698 RepID=UPI001C4FBAD9|nr:1,4-dihydroxy-2-naphthoyl-CoA thioesterase 1-like [Macadamia integrifolia]